MYPAISGIYENVSLKLLEPAPDVEMAEVLVTFLDEVDSRKEKKTRVLGGIETFGRKYSRRFQRSDR
jgi:hypothetical protein